VTALQNTLTRTQLTRTYQNGFALTALTACGVCSVWAARRVLDLFRDSPTACAHSQAGTPGIHQRPSRLGTCQHEVGCITVKRALVTTPETHHHMMHQFGARKQPSRLNLKPSTLKSKSYNPKSYNPKPNALETKPARHANPLLWSPSRSSSSSSSSRQHFSKFHYVVTVFRKHALVL
jgi:hypothetical protein